MAVDVAPSAARHLLREDIFGQRAPALIALGRFIRDDIARAVQQVEHTRRAGL